MVYRRHLSGVSLILGLFFSLSLFATTVLPVGLHQMVDQADKIFYGRCLDTSSELDENGIPSTYAHFRVLEAIRGVQVDEEVLVKFHGVSDDSLHVGEGQASVVPFKTMTLSPKAYAKGSDYLLFLYPESRLGFTSPIGAGQGRFEVLPDQTVLNPLGNRFLKDTLHPGQGGAVPLRELLRDVQGLILKR